MAVSKAQMIRAFNEVAEEAAILGYEDIITSGWSISFNRRKTALGVCRYRSKTVEISVEFMETCDFETLENTIKHEIAHAIAGHAAAHGPEWKAVHRSLGGTATRCTDVGDARPKHSWELYYPATGQVVSTYHRKPRVSLERVYIRGKKSETLGKLKLRKV